MNGAESLVRTPVASGVDTCFANPGTSKMHFVAANPGRGALDLFDLEDPGLDWVRLAAGLGVEAARAETLEAFGDLLAMSCRRKGPFLIELVIA